MATYDQSSQIDIPFAIVGPTSDVRTFASLQGISAEVQLMLDHTRRLFGDGVRIVLEEDPELPNDAHLVFEVTTRGDVDQVLAKEDAWHACCIELPHKASRFFRLHVDVL